MADFIKNIKSRFKNGNVLTKLIFINAGVFILFNVLNVVLTLFKTQAIDFNHYVGVPAIVSEAIARPWTFFTYMFVHANLIHILLNTLVLYWFGQLFLSYFSPKNLGGLYLLGGLGGAVLYIVAFNTIPYYLDMRDSVMVGASASVMAVVFASAFYRPNAEMQLLILGRVKIIYIAFFIFILDFLSLSSPENPGGHIAHIGGAIVGAVFAKQYLKGRDLTRWMNNMLDRLVNLFKAKPKLKVKQNQNKRAADYEYNEQKRNNSDRIDHILDKIKISGYSSLTTEEKKQLFDASNK